MSGGDPMLPPDLDRLLARADVPAMSAALIDRIVAEAARPGRAALPVPRPPRARGRAWTRRGVWGGIVAVNLMLATAVAAAFGGGALTFATIATVARHVVEHIRAPFHHAPHHSLPARPAVTHRLAVPAAAILTAPRVAMPMTAPRSFGAAPPVDRPRVARQDSRLSIGRPVRPVAVGAAPLRLHAGPYAVRHAEQRHPIHDRPRDRARAVASQRGDGARPHPLRGSRGSRGERGMPFASPIAPHADPLPRTEEAGGHDAPVAERGLQGEGGRRFDGPRGQSPTTAGTEGRADDRANAQAGTSGLDRAPGWRRRMRENTPGADAPGWRRRAGMNGGGAGGGGGNGLRAGGGRPGSRMKPLRPGGGGRHPRRF